MLKLASILILIFWIGGWMTTANVINDDESSSLSEWITHLFEKAEVQQVNYAPYEIRDLPEQIRQLGVGETHVQYGRKFVPFSGFREAIEDALKENPVEYEELTDWEESRHQEVSVHTRVFRIGDKGVAVSFYRPNVIIATLGHYENSVDRKNQLVEMNK